MNAVILAAGMGKRLKDLTKDNTKCMVEVDGISLIQRTLCQLDEYNLSKIIIVVGYKKDELIDYISKLDVKTPIEFVSNDLYETTNNIYSLSLVKDKMIEEDTVLLESDIIFEKSVLDSLIYDEHDSVVLVDKFKNWMDGSCVTLNSDNTINSFIKKSDFDFNKTDQYYKTVNIYKFSKEFSKSKYIPYMDIYINTYGKNIYYEEVLIAISMLKQPGIVAKNIDGLKWYEIDDKQDLDIANTMFASNSNIVDEYSSRYGGYWRFNHVLDYCYLVNPHYPTNKLLSELKSISDSLIINYPSGNKIMSNLAGNYYEISLEYILVGNGAAELINILTKKLGGRFGIINPTFEEYKNRINGEIVYLESENVDFNYNQDTIIDFYSKNPVENIILINPDNPTGNYIDIEGLHKLLSWTKSNNVKLIVDESFIDFSDYDNDSLLQNDIMEEFPNLVIIKSLSKSHGVPGIRLGVLASADTKLVESIKSDISIWNINSFGEYYLQIMGKYAGDFKMAIEKFKNERKRFFKELSLINGIKVYPSQANYFMVEIFDGTKASDLCKMLLREQGIFIKDLSSKINDDSRQFVRIAIRKEEENNILINAFKEVKLNEYN